MYIQIMIKIVLMDRNNIHTLPEIALSDASTLYLFSQ